MSDTHHKDNAIDSVMSRVLAPAGLEERHLSRALGSIMRRDIDIADLYFQVSRQESWTVEDGVIKAGSFNLDQGVGVRAVSGEKTGFAYSDELMLPALERAAGAARAISRDITESIALSIPGVGFLPRRQRVIVSLQAIWTRACRKNCAGNFPRSVTVCSNRE